MGKANDIKNKSAVHRMCHIHFLIRDLDMNLLAQKRMSRVLFKEGKNVRTCMVYLFDESLNYTGRKDKIKQHRVYLNMECSRYGLLKTICHQFFRQLSSHP
jgi:geranylgeranyl pyrophosphate synthase